MSKQVKANDKATAVSSLLKQTIRASHPQVNTSAHSFREFSGLDVDKLPTANELDEFTAFSQGFLGSTPSLYGDSDLQKLFQDPPSYDAPGSGVPSQQAQSYMPQQGHPSAFQPNHQFPSQQHQQTVPISQPLYNTNGFAAAQQAPQILGGHGQGLVPVNNYTSYGPISVHAPYSFNNWGNPYGDRASAISNNNYGYSPLDQGLPETQGVGTGDGTLRSAGTTSTASQLSRFNPEARTFRSYRYDGRAVSAAVYARQARPVSARRLSWSGASRGGVGTRSNDRKVHHLGFR